MKTNLSTPNRGTTMQEKSESTRKVAKIGGTDM